jgi:hypothetical protein
MTNLAVYAGLKEAMLLIGERSCKKRTARPAGVSRRRRLSKNGAFFGQTIHPAFLLAFIV